MPKYHKLTNNDTASILTDDNDHQRFAVFDNNDDHNLQSTPFYDADHARDHKRNNERISDDDRYMNHVNNRHNNTNNNTMIGSNSTNSNSEDRIRCTSESGNNMLITNLDVDENSMEIPLLQHNYAKQNSNYEYNKDDGSSSSDYVCLCQQKGFANNLNSKSTQTAKSKILWAIGMCCIFMIVEFLGGYIAGSLAIMTDAAHLASDCISFVIGLVAIWLGNKPPDGKMSFGYKRLEVMGAIISILSIWILTTTLVLVAVQRIFSHDYDLNPDTMMIISGIGILINIIMIFILHTSSDGLPESGIGAAAHGHSHSHHSHSHSHNDNHSDHSHNRNHHGHSQSHSHHSHQSTSPQPNHRLSSSDNSHRHTAWHSVGSVAGAGAGNPQKEDTIIGNSHGYVVDANDAATTSIEMSPGPELLFNKNALKLQQQKGSGKNLNLRAATIHVIGDLVQSFGVFFASILIKLYPAAKVLDPLCTVLFSVIVILTTANLFKESMNIILDAVPHGLSVADLERDLLDIEGVKSIHYLNVWNHTSDHTLLMVHLRIDLLVDSNAVLMKATQVASGPKYNVKHSTIQIERVNS